MTRDIITGGFKSNADLPRILRAYADRFELPSAMVKQMMLDVADEIERLRAEIERLTEAQ